MMLISRQLNRASLLRRLMTMDPAWMLPSLVLLYFIAQIFSPAFLYSRLDRLFGVDHRRLDVLIQMLPHFNPAQHDKGPQTRLPEARPDYLLARQDSGLKSRHSPSKSSDPRQSSSF